MSQISAEIGKQIRTFRKKRKMTLETLAGIICKSKSTVSKYENGEIPVDIETLYEIASSLPVSYTHLDVYKRQVNLSVPVYAWLILRFSPCCRHHGTAALIFHPVL